MADFASVFGIVLFIMAGFGGCFAFGFTTTADVVRLALQEGILEGEEAEEVLVCSESLDCGGFGILLNTKNKRKTVNY